jgi:aminoglycoside phosphotransferase (APT) family kinase protein
MNPRQDNRRSDPRLDALNHWLAGVLGAHVRATRPLSADASFRRYFRVRDLGHSWIVMDAPPEREHPADFVRIAGCLEELGMTVPRVLAADTGAGFLLLEDLGDRTFSRALAAGAKEHSLYALAVDTLAAIQNRWTEAAELEPPAPYDEEELLREARLLPEWYWPQVTGEPCPEAVREAFEQAWHEALAPVFRVPPVLVLRDFHVDNLMVVPGRHGIAACGLLDFQDALLGSPPTTWSPCCATPVETYRKHSPWTCWPGFSRHVPTWTTGISRPRTGSWALSATPRSSAFSHASGSGTASRSTCSICPGCGACWNRNWPNRSLVRYAPGTTPTCRLPCGANSSPDPCTP